MPIFSLLLQMIIGFNSLPTNNWYQPWIKTTYRSSSTQNTLIKNVHKARGVIKSHLNLFYLSHNWLKIYCLINVHKVNLMQVGCWIYNLILSPKMIGCNPRWWFWLVISYNSGAFLLKVWWVQIHRANVSIYITLLWLSSTGWIFSDLITHISPGKADT